jgi:hypothetical protein
MIERLYCLVQCADGRWLVLNRQYKPLNTGITRWVDYDTCAGIRITLTDRQVATLTSDGHPPAHRWGYRKVWLYRDETSPDRSKALLLQYLARVTVLDYFYEMEQAA